MTIKELVTGVRRSLTREDVSEQIYAFLQRVREQQCPDWCGENGSLCNSCTADDLIRKWLDLNPEVDELAVARAKKQRTD